HKVSFSTLNRVMSPVKILFSFLTILALATVSRAAFGVDVATLVSVDTAKCLRGQNQTFAIVRCPFSFSYYILTPISFLRCDLVLVLVKLQRWDWLCESSPSWLVLVPIPSFPCPS